MRTRILENGVWTEGTPTEGEWYQLEVAEGVWQESRYTEVIPETPAILKITKRAFMKRFTLTERIAIRNSVDDVIIDVYEDLKLASYVELDTQDVSDALNYMVSVGILESSRVDEMLVDGTSEEAYP